MTPQLDTLETVGQGIDEARAMILATRKSLQDVLDRDTDVPEFRQVVARLKRMEEELERIEELVAGMPMTRLRPANGFV